MCGLVQWGYVRELVSVERCLCSGTHCPWEEREDIPEHGPVVEKIVAHGCNHSWTRDSSRSDYEIEQ